MDDGDGSTASDTDSDIVGLNRAQSDEWSENFFASSTESLIERLVYPEVEILPDSEIRIFSLAPGVKHDLDIYGA